MILLELRDYLKQKKKTSLLNVSSYFDVSISEAKSMLDFLEKKQLVKVSKNACEDCPLSCNKNCPLFYEWNGD